MGLKIRCSGLFTNFCCTELGVWAGPNVTGVANCFLVNREHIQRVLDSDLCAHSLNVCRAPDVFGEGTTVQRRSFIICLDDKREIWILRTYINCCVSLLALCHGSLELSILYIFLSFIRTKLKRRCNYSNIVKPFDIHLALFIQWRSVFVSTKTTGAGCCNDKTVQAAQFTPLMDF